MFEELKTIELSGKEYPIKCDLLVLEKIQDAYGTIGDFEEGLITWEAELDENGKQMHDEDGNTIIHGKFPKVRNVNDALAWMVTEGEIITAERDKRPQKEISREKLVREVDISLIELANKLHEEFYRCFSLKNAETTQNQTQENLQKM